MDECVLFGAFDFVPTKKNTIAAKCLWLWHLCDQEHEKFGNGCAANVSDVV